MTLRDGKKSFCPFWEGTGLGVYKHARIYLNYITFLLIVSKTTGLLLLFLSFTPLGFYFVLCRRPLPLRQP